MNYSVGLAVPVRRGQARSVLLAATQALIGSHGIHGLTMRLVATHAGVALGSVTYHFADRGELITAALTDYVDRLADTVAAASSTPDTATAAAIEVFTDRDGVLIRTELRLHAARHTLAQPINAQADTALTHLLIACSPSPGVRLSRTDATALVAELDRAALDLAASRSPAEFSAAVRRRIRPILLAATTGQR